MNIRKKIILTLGLSQIIIILALFFVFIVLIEDVKNQIQDKRLGEHIDELSRHLNHKEYKLKSLAKELITNSKYKSILISGLSDKRILLDNLGLFTNLMKENNVNILEVGDKSGVVVFRFHRPSDYGDNKSNQKIIQEALSGKSVTSLEMGNSGLGLRATIPLENVGTLLLGHTVNRAFLREIADFEDIKMALFNNNKLLASSDEIIDNLINELEVHKFINNDNIDKTISRIKFLNHSYYITKRKYDSHGFSNLNLMILIMINEDSIEKYINNIWLMFGGISLIIFILVSSIVFFFFRDLILAIRSLNQAMKDIDKSGNQSNLDINRKDEIGEITKVFLSMKDKIINHQKNLETTIDQRTNELKISKDRATRAYLDLEASQKQLVQSDKMITLGTMLAGVAHEINTPLGAIKANSENILEALRGLILKLNPFQSHLTLEELQTALKILDLSKDPITALSSREARAMRKKVISLLEEERFSNVELLADFIIDLNLVEALERNEEILKTLQLERILSIAADLHGIRKKSTVIKTSAERVSKIVKSLKSFMHFDQDEKKIPADLTEGMETVLIILHNKIKMGIEVTKNYGEDVPQIICFPDELNQVWTNLIHNAIQAMDEKGSLQIDIEKVPSPAGNPDIDKRNPNYTGNYISVSIQDSGSGIPPEIRQKIFQAFFTTKPAGEGSGLGLHIIGKILEKHEGALYLDSEPGRTRFSVLLPVGE